MKTAVVQPSAGEGLISACCTGGKNRWRVTLSTAVSTTVSTTWSTTVEPTEDHPARLLWPRQALLVSGTATDVDARLRELRRRKEDSLTTSVVESGRRSTLFVAQRQDLSSAPCGSWVPLPVALATLAHYRVGAGPVGLYWNDGTTEGRWLARRGRPHPLHPAQSTKLRSWLLLTAASGDSVDRTAVGGSGLSLMDNGGVSDRCQQTCRQSLPQLSAWQWLAVGVALASGELGTFPAARTWGNERPTRVGSVDRGFSFGSTRGVIVSAALLSLGIATQGLGCSAKSELKLRRQELNELKTASEVDWAGTSEAVHGSVRPTTNAPTRGGGGPWK